MADMIARGMAQQANSALSEKMNSVATSHIFATTQSRDDHFTANPTQRVTGVIVSVGSGYQEWNGTSWIDKTAIIKGDKGDKGDVGATGTTDYNNLTNKPTSTIANIDSAVTNSHTHSNKTALDGTTASYTTTEKTKLSGIEENANNYIHPSTHEGNVISITDTGNYFTGTNVETVLQEVGSQLDDIVNNGASNASTVAFNPIGIITSTNVQGAIQQIIDWVNSLSFTSQYVGITTTGSTFSPIVELVNGSTATVTWEVEGGSTYTGLTPTIDFGSSATRIVRMSATKDGVNALGDIITFNVGFDYTQDAGLYNIGATYNHAVQSVSNIQYVNKMTGLLRFLAATSTLACSLDFTGMSSLQFIECFGAAVTNVTLTGCTSLVRLCMESNDLATLDLNPVAGNLYDLRASGNRSPLTFTPLTSPMAHLYHYCAQSETVINHPTAAQLPVIEELWDWNSGQTGALVVSSSAIRNISTQSNSWTSADLTNQFPAGRNGYFDGNTCNFASVILTGCNGLTTINLASNNLNQSAIDGILSEVESWGTSGGSLDLRLNVAPSSAGTANADLLIARGWTVNVDEATGATAPSISSSYNTTSVYTTDEVSIPYTITDSNGGLMSATYIIDGGTPTVVSNLSTGLNTWSVGTLAEGSHTLTIQVADSGALTSNILTFNITSSIETSSVLWSDNFDRADATGVANVGNGWHTQSVMDCNIVSNDLVLVGSGAYGILLNTNTGTLPSDYTVSMALPAGTKGGYFGLVGRWYNGNGVRLLFIDQETITIGDASGYNTNNVTVPTPTFPANWLNDGIAHTIAMRMVGSTIDIILDGEIATTVTCTVNSTQTGTEVGFCGEGQNRVRQLIEVAS